MNRRKYWETLSALSGIVWMLLAGWAYAGTAKDILDAASIKGGLIVHVGCGDGKLTAALRANDSYIVRGLDADANG